MYIPAFGGGRLDGEGKMKVKHILRISRVITTHARGVLRTAMIKSLITFFENYTVTYI